MTSDFNFYFNNTFPKSIVPKTRKTRTINEKILTLKNLDLNFVNLTFGSKVMHFCGNCG